MIVNVEFVRRIKLEVSDDYKLLRYDSPVDLSNHDWENLQAQLIEECYSQIPKNCDIWCIDDAIDNETFYES